MNKLLVLAALAVAATAAACSNVEASHRTTASNAASTPIPIGAVGVYGYKFHDLEAGNTCYVVKYNSHSVAISCLPTRVDNHED